MKRGLNVAHEPAGAQALLAFAKTYIESEAIERKTRTYLDDVYVALDNDEQYTLWCAAIEPLLQIDGFFGVMLDDMSDLMRHMVTEWISDPRYQYVAYFSTTKPGNVSIRYANYDHSFWNPLDGSFPPAAMKGFERKACPFFK